MQAEQVHQEFRVRGIILGTADGKGFPKAGERFGVNRSNGLICNASPSSLAAPASSLRIKTPRFMALATYSFATKFIPSRKGVMSPTSADWYKAQSSSKST
jgi:hypothetical protein